MFNSAFTASVRSKVLIQAEKPLIVELSPFRSNSKATCLLSVSGNSNPEVDANSNSLHVRIKSGESYFWR